MLALSGRAMTVDARRGRTIYQGAHGAPATRYNGPLKRVVGSLAIRQLALAIDGHRDKHLPAFDFT